MTQAVETSISKRRPAIGRLQVPADVGAAIRADAAAVLPATAALVVAVAAACRHKGSALRTAVQAQADMKLLDVPQDARQL